jgi:hypothetical protein
MFRPLLEWLKQKTECRLRVISLCELRGLPTPVEEIQRAGAETCLCLPIRIPKNVRPTRASGEQIKAGSSEWVRTLVWHGLINWPRFYRRERPSLAVLPNDCAFPNYKIAARLRREAIPFLLVQEGIRFEQPSQPIDRQYGQGGAIAVAAWGPASGRYFERVGVSPDRIHIVGNPRLDEMARRDWGKVARDMAAELGIDSRILLYVSNPIDHQGLSSTKEKYQLFVDFLRAARRFLDQTSHQMVVKVHRGESLDDFTGLVDQEAGQRWVSVVGDVPLHPLLHLSSGVVVLASTAGLEAMLMDRPVGVLPTPRAGYAYDYVETGAAFGLTLDGELSEQLRELVDDDPAIRQRRRAYVEDQVVNFGNATEALGNLILQLT